MGNKHTSLQHVLIVENSFRPGVGLHIAKLFRSENDPNLNSLVVDTGEVATSLEAYKSDVVILDVDSLRHANALDVAVAIRERNPNQVIMFSSDRSNPIPVKKGTATAHVTAFGFGGTATYTSIAFETTYIPLTTGTTTPVRPCSTWYQTSAGGTISISDLILGGSFRITRIMGVNCWETDTPQIKFSAKPGAPTNSIQANSYLTFTPLGSNTVTTAGAWS